MAPVNILRFISILPPSTAGADQIIRVTLAAEWDPWGLEKLLEDSSRCFKTLFPPIDLLYWPGNS